jgi:hypothetical protein
MLLDRERFIRDGFAIVPRVLPIDLLDRVRTATESSLAKQTAEDLERDKYLGSDIKVDYDHSCFAELIALPTTLKALTQLGYEDPRWWKGYVVSKPPHAPALYWHQDWRFWRNPISLDPRPMQLFVMYYLTDTSPENGCLRIIPGSHYRRSDLHALLPAAHSDEALLADEDSPLFDDHPSSVAAAVSAGDVLIGDARLLHSAFANRTDARRTLVILWFFGDWPSLPDSIKAFVARNDPLEKPNWWTEASGRLVEPLVPWYFGDVDPEPVERFPIPFVST